MTRQHIRRSTLKQLEFTTEDLENLKKSLMDLKHEEVMSAFRNSGEVNFVHFLNKYFTEESKYDEA